MLSSTHEGLVHLFRDRPSLAAELLAGPLRVSLPSWDRVRLDSGELTDVAPTEYRADAVVTLSAAGSPVAAVVVEVQLRRDRGKQWSWPVYVATLRARLRCPCVLLVVCADASIAGWSRTAIDLGHPGWVLRPLVVGPDVVPMVTDVAQARDDPQLAVLSALAHSGAHERDKVLHALLAALSEINDEHAAMYSDLVFAALPAAARNHLEALMNTGTYEYQSEFVRRYIYQGRAEGRAEGEARAVLAVLAARGIDVPEDARVRITECTDMEQLDVWVRRAGTAESVEELFD